ncbi:coiled-coil domain-containing protein 106-like [Carassius gibelio]|uniref:coiled-coil domain-containing protein 106-like n=1 Tax=Carassius gibelio TaxID=101364 RepID=UPI002279875F|nr:coiled-coil domain-containing protein 106-like [Carassius gibelio]
MGRKHVSSAVNINDIIVTVYRIYCVFFTCKQPKARKKTEAAKDVSMVELTKNDPNGPEEKKCLPPSASGSSISSLGSGSISKVEFLEAKIEWQEKMIKDLEQERNFLREQILMGKKTSTQPKAVDLEESENSGDSAHDNIPPSSPNISESSDSDVLMARQKTKHTWPSASAPVAVPSRTHMRVKGPAEVIRRYKKVLKTFSRVRTMTEAFRANGVDRGTIKMTAPIAELHIVDPETYKSLRFDPANETLLSFSKKCATHISPEKKAIIEDMKSRGQLLPLLMKY